jgi:ATP-dependent DNA helicase MPH1
VATSVGEEGLDIGEVDLIVCYDAQKTPIRMVSVSGSCVATPNRTTLQLQRVGRTGRKRKGNIHVLLAQGREEKNWDRAKEAHNQVQKAIVHGDQLELYGDVDRLLPDHIKPECLEMVVEIEEYASDQSQNMAKDPSPRNLKKCRQV